MSRRAGRSPMLAILLALAWPGAHAQEFQPYPAPHVTVEQWAEYLKIVEANFGSNIEVFKQKKIVVFMDAATRTHYIFTTKGHAAHPAWITRQIVEESGKVNVRQIGYFAGEEEPFAKLFAEYQQMNDQLRESVQRRNQ